MIPRAPGVTPMDIDVPGIQTAQNWNPAKVQNQRCFSTPRSWHKNNTRIITRPESVRTAESRCDVFKSPKVPRFWVPCTSLMGRRSDLLHADNAKTWCHDASNRGGRVSWCFLTSEVTKLGGSIHYLVIKPLNGQIPISRRSFLYIDDCSLPWFKPWLTKEGQSTMGRFFVCSNMVICQSFPPRMVSLEINWLHWQIWLQFWDVAMLVFVEEPMLFLVLQNQCISGTSEI